MWEAGFDKEEYIISGYAVSIWIIYLKVSMEVL